MEFSDLDWNKPIQPNKVNDKPMNGIWDFDLLGKSDGDVFDVNFLQSQATDIGKRGGEANSFAHKDDTASKEQMSKPKIDNTSPSMTLKIEDQRLKDEKLAKLVSAGFDAVKAGHALESCQWDMELAVDMLLNGSGSPTKEMHPKSPSRQSEVLQAFGMSVFKGAQKVFDYSKKKISEVVESSKSSGWMGELNKDQQSLFQKSTNNDALYSETSKPGKPERPKNVDHVKHQNTDTPNIASGHERTLSNSSTTSVNKSDFSRGPSKVNHANVIPNVQKKQESLLIADLSEIKTVPQMAPKVTDSIAVNQNFDLLDSSADFSYPTPAQFSTFSQKTDPLKPSNNSLPSSQGRQNIPLIPNQGLLNQMASNSSLNRSWTTAPASSNTPYASRPAAVGNLDSLDPFSGTSNLQRSNSTSTAKNLTKTLKPDDFNLLSLNGTKKESQIIETPQEDLFNFGSKSNFTAQASSQKKTDIKKPITKSFMIFDSIGNEGYRENNHSHKNIVSHEQSDAHLFKEKGNEFFKAGQYAEAESQYTLGIKSLPDMHPLLATLYNNRAGARLKIGSYNEAIQDCSKVQEFDPNDVKSLLRRAQAYEALEKWDEAQADYRRILVLDPTVKSVSQSLVRCSKALQSPNIGAHSNSRPAMVAVMSNAHNILQPFQPSVKSRTTEISSAVQNVRDKNRQAENEDALKLALKDQIDDKINSWRKGKEDNLRALLSSLDVVLWKELEWKSINLSEIITTSQVKIKYLKAIAKVHPDKLGSNVTIEKQLIANSVFSTLNKAWDTFKLQNGI